MKIDRSLLVYILGSFLGLCGAFGLGIYVFDHVSQQTQPTLVEMDISTPGANVFATKEEELLALVVIHPYKAFTRLREMLVAEPELYNECHGIVHQLGHEAFEVFGFQDAMRMQDALCGGGYVHGIIEARFGMLNETQILGVLPSLCEEGNSACFHGLGHGLMITTYLDTDASLAYCDLLADDGRSDCYDGVWMHIFDLEESGSHDLSQQQVAMSQQDIEDYASRCYGANSRYKTNCYFYLPRILAHNEQVEFMAYRNICENVEDAYRLTCSAGSGHSVMKYNIATPNDAVQLCESYTTSGMLGACKEGAFVYYLFAGGLSAIQTPSLPGNQDKCDVFTGDADRALCNRVDGYRESL
jgi:hypothetical protein